jgi:hypothetical protein
METFAASTERGRRARWWRILLWMLALGLAVASVAMAIGWMAFHQLRSDLAASNARLPAKLGSVLSGGAPSTGSGTFLIAAPQGGIPGAVLMRVDPSTGVATTVKLGPRARVGANRVGDLTDRGDVTSLVGALAQEGIPVNHVLLLTPGQIGNMIDAVGGVAVSAPTAVTLLDSSGRSFGIRRGQVRLHGALADAYLFGQEEGDPAASPEQRQLDGLAAVGAAVLEPSSGTLRTPNHLGGVIAKHAATDLTATTYLDELHAWGDVSRTVRCGAVDSNADATSMLAVLAGPGAGSATPANCSTASVRPSAWFRRLGLLGSDPAAMLVLVGGLALLGAGICLLALELSSPGFRSLRDRRRWAEAEAGPSQTAAPAASAPFVSPPAARRRLRLPDRLRNGQSARLHRRRFDPGRSRIGLPSWWTRRRPAAISGGFPIRVGPFRRHHHVVGGRGNLAGYAAVLAVAVGSGFVIAQLLTR